MAAHLHPPHQFFFRFLPSTATIPIALNPISSIQITGMLSSPVLGTVFLPVPSCVGAFVGAGVFVGLGAAVGVGVFVGLGVGVSVGVGSGVSVGVGVGVSVGVGAAPRIVNSVSASPFVYSAVSVCFPTESVFRNAAFR